MELSATLDRWGASAPPRVRTAWRAVGPAALVLLVQQILWPIGIGSLVSGLILGGLGALGALSMALIWRANRVVNFAQGDLGTLPTTFVLLAFEVWKIPYVLGLPLGLASALVVGALSELLIVRRFARAPRLTLTVATVGLSQLLTFCALLLPSAFGLIPADRSVAPPFSAGFTIGVVVFDANDILAAIVAPLCVVLLVWFLRSTDAGVAIRAAAERSERAAMLGVPVGRLQTGVWAIAALLSFVSVFFTAGVTSLPTGFGVSLAVVLRALAALVMGRMTNLVSVATSAVALGVLDAAIRANETNSDLLAPLLLLIILISLLTQRRSAARVDVDDASSWNAADEVRPVPAALAALPLVRLLKIAGVLLLAALVIGFPNWVGAGVALKGGAVLIFATIGISLVVLTGWAGQASLAQMTFVGFGGAACAWAIVDRGLDPALAMAFAGVVGAIVAVLVGIPALRLRGLYLAVVTLALALAASSAVFSNSFVDWIPLGSFPRPVLFGRVSLDSPTRVFYLALVVLVLAASAAVAIRRSRIGRVLVALRENERAAVAYGISPVRAKLVGFALSGAIAAIAGATFVIHQASFRADSYGADQSVAVFVAAIIGGVATVPGAIIGAVYLRGAQWLLPADWQIFATSVGVLAVLMILPEGLGGLVFRVRDAGLRAIARRTGTDAPGLLSAAESERIAAERAASAAAPATDPDPESDPMPPASGAPPEEAVA